MVQQGSGKADGVAPTTFWHRLGDGRVECGVCPRHCRLKDGQRGFCFVRANRGGAVVLTSYGLSSGFCVDPIEKKPLNHFLPGTPVLSFGTAGCNLSCRFCQNWDMTKSREMARLADRAEPAMVAEAAVRLGCRSVAFTYNDPVVFLEYAMDTADACRARGIRSVAVTAGYLCDAPRREFFRRMDAANIDLKAFSESFYERICSGHLQDVLDTLAYVKRETDTWLEITTLLIPGENDGDDELRRMAAWVAEHLGPDVPWHFSAFHPDWKMRDKPSTPPATLQRARSIARGQGMRYVYLGNVHDEEGSRTCCPGCGSAAIGRDGYRITEWGLAAEGRCARCGSAVPGRFEDRPGDWGARRMQVRLREEFATGDGTRP